MTDLAKLKELAEAATPDPWWVMDDMPTWVDGTALDDNFEGPALGVDGYETDIAMNKRWEAGLADAAYIAAANPAAILALISRLEEAEKERDKFKADCIDWMNMVSSLRAEKESLTAQRDEAVVALEKLAKFFTNAEHEAGYLVANEEETGIGDMKTALEAVVFNDDGQDFLMWVRFAEKHAQDVVARLKGTGE